MCDNEYRPSRGGARRPPSALATTSIQPGPRPPVASQPEGLRVLSPRLQPQAPRVQQVGVIQTIAGRILASQPEGLRILSPRLQPRAPRRRALGIPPIVALLLALILSATLLGCTQGTPSATKSSVSLKIGLLPIVDVLPMYVAEQEGYYREQDLQVELVLFPSALERDSAFVAAQIDGELNDPVSAGLLSKDGDRARMVRLAYKGNESMAMMVVLAAPDSKIGSAKELKGVPVGISGNSIIEYATDRLLQAGGLTSADIVKTEVTKIPVRAEMLAKGQIQAATLPEPLASLAVQQGARVVTDDSKTGHGKSVITFRSDVVAKNADAVKRFLAAYEKGVAATNAAPAKYTDLMVDKAKVPDSLKATFKVPRFPTAQTPSRDDISDVVAWMVERKLLDQPIPYESMVSEGLLPR